MHYQRGTTTVEFAIIAGAALTVLFGVIEVGRALFVWNTAAEMTRRGARVAAVCPINHPTIGEIAIFNQAGGGAQSSVLNGLTTANINVEYLDDDGNATATYPDVSYVRVSIINYQHTMLIPFSPVTIPVPPFTTTIPAESLGYVPDLELRECFGS